MSKHSEDVLLVVASVKHKKVEGSLYMMATRMAWMPSHMSTFRISHNYADIRVQKISPDTKEKVQLQVVMHDNSANTFQFNNPEGRASQEVEGKAWSMAERKNITYPYLMRPDKAEIAVVRWIFVFSAKVKDREGVKELLQNLLPKFKMKISSELEEKNRMLQEDPELFQLYKDLVVSGVISAEEFWSNRKSSQVGGNKFRQDIGVSTAFLADINPETDGCNGLKYNLTTDIIESIFRTYPAVKDLHMKHVPDNMTEEEFWTKFFQSHYFHRDRISSSSRDIFSECAKADDKVIQKEIHKHVTDPLVDLTQIKDTTLDEGYGSHNSDAKASVNPTNASMIRRFNYHSTMVLKSSEKDSGGSANAVSEVPEKKRRVLEKLDYDDLMPVETDNATVLRLTNMDHYKHGPTPITASQYNTSEEMLASVSSVNSQIRTWNTRLVNLLSPSLATSAMGELSPGGALMHGNTHQQLTQIVPREMKEEIRQNYTALCELLRHFWLCFPTTNKELEEKVVRMRTNLERFHTAKLNPLKSKLHNFSYSMNLTGHMEDMLACAYNKYETWHSKRTGRR